MTSSQKVHEQVDILQHEADQRFGHLLTSLEPEGRAATMRRQFAREVIGEAERLRAAADRIESEAFPGPSLNDPGMPDYHEAVDRVLDAVAQSHVLAMSRLARLARDAEASTRDEIERTLR